MQSTKHHSPSSSQVSGEGLLAAVFSLVTSHLSTWATNQYKQARSSDIHFVCFAFVKPRDPKGKAFSPCIHRSAKLPSSSGRHETESELDSSLISHDLHHLVCSFIRWQRILCCHDRALPWPDLPNEVIIQHCWAIPSYLTSWSGYPVFP